VGSTGDSVTVTTAPLQLETINATLGGVMENQTYQNLPVVMGHLNCIKSKDAVGKHPGTPHDSQKARIE
jgi:hypothetical protein